MASISEEHRRELREIARQESLAALEGVKPIMTASVTAAVMAQVAPMFGVVNEQIRKMDDGQKYIIQRLDKQDENEARKEAKIDRLTETVTDAVTRLATREGKDIASDKYKERDKGLLKALWGVVGAGGLLTLWRWAASHFWGK